MKALLKMLMCVATMAVCPAILSTAGCRSLRPAYESKTVHDSNKVEKTVSFRDTILKTQPAAVRTTLSIPNPEVFKQSLTASTKQNRNAMQTIKMVGDSLQVDCLCDTVAIAAKLKDTYEHQYHSTTTVTEKIIPEKYIPGWVKFLAWSGGVYWAFQLITFLFTLLKK